MPSAEGLSGHLLLDTHVWLWAAEGAEGKLSSGCLTELRQANREGRIWVSVISVWEIAMLESLDRIILSRACAQWVREELAAPGMNLAQLTPEIAIDSTRLPEGFHRDPADRILIATARCMQATLVTADEAILEYGSRGYVNVIAAS